MSSMEGPGKCKKIKNKINKYNLLPILTSFEIFLHAIFLNNTYSGKWVVQVVNGPSNDYNVVDVKPEGEDSCSKAHTWRSKNDLDVF